MACPTCGEEPLISEAIVAGQQQPVFPNRVDIGRVASTFAVALHMHQPLIPAADGGDLRTAPIVSNLAWMMDHQDIGDNHNAPVFMWCYKRMGEFVRQLLGEARQPRVMLDYSGTLLYGMRQMGLDDVFDELRYLANDPGARRPPSGWAAPGATRWLHRPPCRITGCMCAPGSITSPRSSVWRRPAGCGGSLRPRWHCPASRTWPTSPHPARLRL